MRKKFRILVVVVMVVVLLLVNMSVASAADANPIKRYQMGQVEMITSIQIGADGYNVYLNLNGYVPRQIMSRISGDFTEDEIRYTIEQGGGSVHNISDIVDVAPQIQDVLFYSTKILVNADNGNAAPGDGTNYVKNVYNERNLMSSTYNFIQPGNRPVNSVEILGWAGLAHVLKNGTVEGRRTTHSIYMDGQLMLDVTVVPKGAGRVIGSYKIYTPNFQAQTKSSAMAKSTASKIYVDGKEISIGAYLIDNSNYVKLRDVAYALKDTSASFSVQWQQGENQIYLKRDAPYEPDGTELQVLSGSSLNVPVSSSQILCEFVEESFWHPKDDTWVYSYSDVQEVAHDGLREVKYIYMRQEVFQPQAYNIGGNNYYKLRDVGHIAGFGVSWDEVMKSVRISTGE